MGGTYNIDNLPRLLAWAMSGRHLFRRYNSTSWHVRWIPYRDTSPTVSSWFVLQPFRCRCYPSTIGCVSILLPIDRPRIAVRRFPRRWWNICLRPRSTRYPIRGYKPSFTLHRIDLLDIELDDPVWLYVSRHNDDRLLYRIDKWIRKILGKKCSSSNCCDAWFNHHIGSHRFR